MSETGRRIRLGATAAALVLVIAGSLWGDDDNWPFGPFRMYSTTQHINGSVREPFFRALTETGEVLRLGASDMGLKRAEILGQRRRIEAHPELLRSLALAHANFHPEAPRIEKLSLVMEVHKLRNGRPVSTSEQVLVTWARASS